jgi:hypothetical protein
VKLTTYAGCVLSSLAVIFASPGASAQSNEAAATAHRLVVRSGLSVQLRSFTGQIEGEIRQNPARLDDKLVNALADAAKEAFRPEALQEDITGRVGKMLSVTDMKTALGWLESDAGRRVTQSEELSSASFDVKSLQAYAERLKAKPLGAKRQQLIAELLGATGAVKAVAAVQEAMALGVALGMDSLQPPERRVGETALRGRIRQMMPPEKLQAVLAQQLPVMSAYTYRDISDADLEGYVRFLKTVGGKRYHDSTTAALTEALGRASVRTGELAAQRQRQTTI